MKNKLCLLTMMAGVFVLLTGCENPIEKITGENKYQQYEIHFYDEDFKHTEELEVNYDKDGKLKDIAAYYVYDASTNRNCEYAKKPEKDYKNAKSECTKNSDGSVKFYAYLTAEAIEDGALEDDAFSLIYYAYDTFDTEEKMKSYIDSTIEELKNSNADQDERNYIISDGKKVEW